jgi:hypothetical protein
MFRILFSLLLSLSVSSLVQAQEEFFDWCQENPDLVSLAILEQGEMIVEHQAYNDQAVAEGVFLLLAAEFAQMAGEDLLDPELLVPIEEIQRFSLPALDGDRFRDWTLSAKGSAGEEADHVPLWMVVQGMMQHQSMANAEYLIRLMGRERCSSLGSHLAFGRHGRVYPLQSARLLYLGLDMPPHKKATHLRNMPLEDYEALAWDWSDSLAQDYDGTWQASVQNLDFSLRKVWSSRLPYGQTAAYAAYAEKLRTREGWSEDALTWFKRVAEPDAASIDERFSDFHCFGGASGRTDYLYHLCRYATTESGSGLSLSIHVGLRKPEDTRTMVPMVNAFVERVLRDPGALEAWMSAYPVDGE